MKFSSTYRGLFIIATLGSFIPINLALEFILLNGFLLLY